jgi:hypothetical protein
MITLAVVFVEEIVGVLSIILLMKKFATVYAIKVIVLHKQLLISVLASVSAKKFIVQIHIYLMKIVVHVLAGLNVHQTMY